MGKRIVIITDIPFWRHIAGHMARLTSLVNFLSKNFQLTVIYGGFLHISEKKTLINPVFNIKLVTFNSTQFGMAYFSNFVKQYLLGNIFDICIIEYVELSYLLDSIPEGTKKYLDTHDLKSKRESEFAKLGLSHEKFSWKEEIHLFKQYDKVLLIQKNDYKKATRSLGRDRTILASHAVNLPRVKLRKKVSNIGFIASSYPPNIDGLVWFLNNIWQSFEDYDIRLTIYGSICIFSNLLNKYRNVCFMGSFSRLEDVYQKVDIVINPVQFGAGIKIKNLEALGSGLPLITLPHGSIGLEDLSNKGFIVAKNKKEFRDMLIVLIKDYNLRKSIADRAYDYISRYHSPEYCFKSLMNCIIYE